MNQLLPDDEVVVIERDFDSAEPINAPTRSNVIVDAVQRSDLVAVVEVDDVAGVLVEEGTWIRTRLTGTLREVVRSAKKYKFSRGQRVEMEINAGGCSVLRVPMAIRGILVHRPRGRDRLVSG